MKNILNQISQSTNSSENKLTQLTFNCSKSAIETRKKDVKYVQS